MTMVSGAASAGASVTSPAAGVVAAGAALVSVVVFPPPQPASRPRTMTQVNSNAMIFFIFVSS